MLASDIVDWVYRLRRDCNPIYSVAVSRYLVKCIFAGLLALVNGLWRSAIERLEKGVSTESAIPIEQRLFAAL